MEFDEPDNELPSVAPAVDELPANCGVEDDDASAPLVDELELVFGAVVAPLGEDPEVVLPADPEVVLEPVAAVDPEAAVDATPVAEPALDAKAEPVVDDPGHTMVSPLHIAPVEQSLSVYWQLVEHSCAVTEVSVVQEQLWPHSDMLLASPTRLHSVLQSSEVEAPPVEVQMRRAQLPCVDWRKRAVELSTGTVASSRLRTTEKVRTIVAKWKSLVSIGRRCIACDGNWKVRHFRKISFGGDKQLERASLSIGWTSLLYLGSRASAYDILCPFGQALRAEKCCCEVYYVQMCSSRVILVGSTWLHRPEGAMFRSASTCSCTFPFDSIPTVKL